MIITKFKPKHPKTSWKTFPRLSNYRCKLFLMNMFDNAILFYNQALQCDLKKHKIRLSQGSEKHKNHLAAHAFCSESR